MNLYQLEDAGSDSVWGSNFFTLFIEQTSPEIGYFSLQLSFIKSRWNGWYSANSHSRYNFLE